MTFSLAGSVPGIHFVMCAVNSDRRRFKKVKVTVACKKFVSRNSLLGFFSMDAGTIA